MKKFIWILFILGFSLSAKANWLEDGLSGLNQASNEFIDKFLGPQYPEEKNKIIEIYTGESPLRLDSRENKLLKKINKNFGLENLSQIVAQSKDLVVNKMVAGNGLIDITLQVKNGVYWALKDIFAGYLEYERRVATEEMINANLNAHYKTQEFLLGTYSHEFLNTNNLLNITAKISKTQSLKRISKLFVNISKAILIVLSMLYIFKNFHKNSTYIFMELILKIIGIYILISSMHFLINLLIEAALLIQKNLSILLIDFDFSLLNLNYSWQSLANEIGYLPAQILSILDILAQIFIFFYLGGLIFFVVSGSVLSPLWCLGLISESMKYSSYNSLIHWVKTLLILTLMPLAYFIIELIIKEFSNLNNDLLNVVISISSLIYLPSLTNIVFKNGPSGLLRSSVSGYESLIHTIQNFSNSLREDLANKG